MNNKKYIEDFLYKEAIKEEKRDRKEKKWTHDYKIIDLMISEINQLGYNLKYGTDLRLREFHDKNIIPIYKKYYLQFENLGWAEDLLNLVAQKGFYESIPLVIQLYEQLKRIEGVYQSAACDNAFVDIHDKNSLNVYMKYLKNEEDAIRLPCTMEMLGKWKVEEAKEWFYHYLESEKRELVFIAIRGLSYYEDIDKKIREKIGKQLNSQDKDIVSIAQKVIRKMNKRGE